MGHREAITHSDRTEIIPGKHSHTRIKPLALASGHGRYITVTPERALVSVGEWPLHIAVTFLTVSLPKPPCNGRFTSETAIWIRKWLKMSVGTSRKPQLEQFFKARAMGVVIAICEKWYWGSVFDLGR